MNNAIDTAEQIIPAVTQVIVHSFWVGIYAPETGPQQRDIYDVQHLVVGWRLTPKGPVPILFPAISDQSTSLAIRKTPLFVGVLMPDGYFRNIYGDDIRTDMNHAKESALYDAQRWWGEHDR